MSSRRHVRRWRWPLRLLLGLGACVLAAWGLIIFLRPAPQARTEILPGVYYTCVDFGDAEPDIRGRMMAVEIHLTTPGLEFFHRAFDLELMPQGRLWRLSFADAEVLGQDLAVLLNSTLYEPSGALDSLPGQAVASVETVVADGIISHEHEHSYLLWWDAEQRGRMELTKPPPAEALRQARLAVGLQGVRVAQGELRPWTSWGDEELIPRSFIGIDGPRKVVWLLAFEGVKSHRMGAEALRLGVQDGGQLDSGNSTNLIIGEGKGVRPLTGIRNLRPLGGYFGLRHHLPEGS